MLRARPPGRGYFFFLYHDNEHCGTGRCTNRVTKRMPELEILSDIANLKWTSKSRGGGGSDAGKVRARLDARRVERQRAAPADLGLARVAEARVDEPEADEPVDVVRGSVREAVEDFPRRK